MKPGIYDLSAADYHDDPADQPSLSASIAHILTSRSPLHAWTAHSRLNPAFERREEQKFSVGNAVHAVFLEGRDVVTVVDADSWRTAAAKEERDEALAAGRIPLLREQWIDVQGMLAALTDQVAAHEAVPPLFADGKPERTLVWEEDGVWCRARLDWLRDDRATIDDLKTTSRSAHPLAYSRALFGVGGDVQAAFYLRGMRMAVNTRPDVAFRWVVVETAPPYALSVIRPGADVLALGEAKVEKAIRLWRECLESGSWPAYGTGVAEAAMPPWEEARFMEREAMEEVAA